LAWTCGPVAPRAIQAIPARLRIRREQLEMIKGGLHARLFCCLKSKVAVGREYPGVLNLFGRPMSPESRTCSGGQKLSSRAVFWGDGGQRLFPMNDSRCYQGGCSGQGYSQAYLEGHGIESEFNDVLAGRDQYASEQVIGSVNRFLFAVNTCSPARIISI
jgi:hypothetical protein